MTCVSSVRSAAGWGLAAAVTVAFSWANPGEARELSAATTLRPGQEKVPLTAKLVLIATDTTDPHNLSDTEPSIAVNPKDPQQIAVVTFSEGWDYLEKEPQKEDMAPIWKSNDGGKNWKKVRQIPCPRLGFGGPADQKIAFDAQGKLVVVEMTKGARPPRCYIYRQTANDPDAPLKPGKPFGYDQPLLELDNSAGGNCASHLYCSCLNYVRKEWHRAAAVVSIDSGQTLKHRLELGDATKFCNGTTRIAVAPKGEVYLLYKTREGDRGGGFEQAHFWVSRSDDCGKTWTKAVCVHGANSVKTFCSTREHPFGEPKKGKTGWASSSDAWMAVNPKDGSVYVAFVNKDKSGFGQIYVVRSDDMGDTWKKPSRVTDGQNHSAYPILAVAKTGAVGVLYVDYDDSKTMTCFRHRFARSFDGGKTWTDQILQELNPNCLDNAISGFLWGDYQGLTVHEETFYGVFTGESIGRTKRQLDPIFFTEKAKK